MNWEKSAAGVRWNVRALIDGRYRAPDTAECFDNINPATESVLCQVPVGTAEQVDEAVRNARQRFQQGSWSQLSARRRAEVLLRWADLIARNRSEIALLDTLEMGKPIRLALYDAEVFAPECIRVAAAYADKLAGQSAPLQGSTVAFNIREPRGVVGAITPWNFPVVNAVIKLAAALAAGNCVVLKPSELAPSSALKVAELALEAGVPEGVVNVVPGLGSTVGAALALHPDIDLLTFTGSTATGRKILELSGRSNGKPVLLECGGKSPHVVFSDVHDLDVVADAAVEGVLWNQGQVCSARTRLIVHYELAESLLNKVLDRLRDCRPADPLNEGTTFGPLASSAQRARVRSYVESGLREGARAALRGTIRESGGCYVSPTVFDRVTPEMTIVTEEIFGPVLCVQEFHSDDEAIALANGTPYGLAATAWTRDIGRSKRLAHTLRAGEINIRTSGKEDPSSGYSLGSEPQKASGFGAELGLEGLQAYSTLKAVSFTGN